MNSTEFNKEVHDFTESVKDLTQRAFLDMGNVHGSAYALCYNPDPNSDKKLAFAVLEGLFEILKDKTEGYEKRIEIAVEAMSNHIEPLALAIVSEGWAVEGRNESDIMNDDGTYKIKPADHPNKIEVVHLSIETSKTEYMILWKIQRDPDSQPILVQKDSLDWQAKNPNRPSGVFQNLLKKAYVKVTQDQSMN